jgi:DNA gyrase subunit B
MKKRVKQLNGYSAVQIGLNNKNLLQEEVKMTVENIWKALDDDSLKDSIRKRPGMYIGGIGPTGLESMVLQVLDSLISLAVDLKQTELSIELSDNQLIFSFFSEKGLYLEKEQKDQYTSPYLFLAVVNALSEQLGFGVEKAGKRTIQIYQNGQLNKKALIPSDDEGQRIELAFTPNQQIFGAKPLSYFILFNRCQELAMLNSGLTISLTDGKQQKNHLCYQQGLIEYIFQKDDSITRGSQPLVINTVNEGVLIQAVISKNGSTSIKDSFVNGHLPADGGTHLDGFVQGTVDAINQYLEDTNRLKYLTVDNFSERFDFVLSIKVKRPRYTGAVKKKIRNPELYKIVKEAVYTEVTSFLKRHPSWYAN